MHPTFCCSCPVGQLPEREVTLVLFMLAFFKSSVSPSGQAMRGQCRAAVAASTMDTTARHFALHGAMEE